MVLRPRTSGFLAWRLFEPPGAGLSVWRHIGHSGAAPWAWRQLEPLCAPGSSMFVRQRSDMAIEALPMNFDEPKSFLRHSDKALHVRANRSRQPQDFTKKGGRVLKYELRQYIRSPHLTSERFVRLVEALKMSLETLEDTTQWRTSSRQLFLKELATMRYDEMPDGAKSVVLELVLFILQSTQTPETAIQDASMTALLFEEAMLCGVTFTAQAALFWLRLYERHLEPKDELISLLVHNLQTHGTQLTKSIIFYIIQLSRTTKNYLRAYEFAMQGLEHPLPNVVVPIAKKAFVDLCRLVSR